MPSVQSLFDELTAQRNELEPDKQSPFILPEHEEMYRTNRCGVSYRINKFLTSLGIETTRETAGARRASVKDFHSLRHTFAYLAGVNHIPLSIVQAVLGHMSPQMTQRYQEHATREDKMVYMKTLPSLLGDRLLTKAEQAMLIASVGNTEQVNALSLSPEESDRMFWRRKVEKLLGKLSVDDLKSIVKQYGNQAPKSQKAESNQQ